MSCIAHPRGSTKKKNQPLRKAIYSSSSGKGKISSVSWVSDSWLSCYLLSFPFSERKHACWRARSYVRGRSYKPGELYGVCLEIPYITYINLSVDYVCVCVCSLLPSGIHSCQDNHLCGHGYDVFGSRPHISFACLPPRTAAEASWRNCYSAPSRRAPWLWRFE